ncbi:MAG: ABC transporter permease [Chloroflexi bacterium]|nr:ABC transporter permease [Chloroflexota bacterium]
MELIQLAVGNLMRARARLIMTAGGVLVGTAAVILLVAITIGLQTAAEAGIGNNASLTEMDVYPAYNPNIPYEDMPQMNIDAVRAFRRIPNVLAVIPSANLNGGGEIIAGDYNGYGSVIGVDVSLLPYMGISAEQGELALGEGQVLIGPEVAKNFYDPDAEEWTPVEVDLFTTPLKMRIYQWSGENPANQTIKLNVAGILAPGSSYDYYVIMPIQDVIEYNEWTDGTEFDPETFTFGRVTVRARDRETTNEVATAIRELGYEVSGMADFLNQLNQFFGTMRLMLGGVGGVALLVAAFGVANTMTMAILERTKEIGLMKAIGASDRDVMTIFLVEAALVGFSGGAAGVGLSFFIQNLVNTALQNAPQGEGGINFLPIDPSQLQGNLFVIPPELTLFAVLLATAVGIGAGLLPALRAARMLPVLALKSE